MKRTILALGLSAAMLLSVHAQKKTGSIYAEHAYINKTKALWEAFVDGNRSKYQGFFADSIFVTSNGSPGELIGKSDIGGNIPWWQNEFTDLEVKNQEPAYPDALDYKEGVDWVQDWRVLTARHTKSGINVNTPIHSLYAFNDEGKIVMLVNYFNNDVFEQIRDSQTTTENGEVYDNHPHILTVRKLVNTFADADAEAYAGFFTDDAIFNFSWDKFGESHDKEETMSGMKKMFADGFKAEVEQVGYPDCVYYERGNSWVVYSWWKQSVMKDGKNYEYPVMMAHTFNDDGKIISESVYASSNHFE